MNSTRTNRGPIQTPHQRGQALILVALTFLILLAIVGLATDVGQLFIYMGHLRRATDAASLAAAAQFREGRSTDEMSLAARQVMNMNGVDPTLYTITVETCENAPGDPQLCTTPRRKVVRVNGTLLVPMSFLGLVGVNDVPISASSIGEAASLDVVLVLDISESMSFDAAPGSEMRDPHRCNSADPSGADGYPGECLPFEDVKDSASKFISSILNKPPDLEEDRLTIVTFASGWSGDMDLGTHYRTHSPSGLSPWISDRDEAQDIVRNLKMFEPGKCWVDKEAQIPDTFYGPCRDYDLDGATYLGFDCLSCVFNGTTYASTGLLEPLDPIDLSAFTTTNIGGALRLGGNAFALEKRDDTVWVMVLLTDGMANATMLDPNRDQDLTDPATYPLGFCPNEMALNGEWVTPLCQDENISESQRHHDGDALYDADDFARDMADFVGCHPTNPLPGCNGTRGQGVVIFTVGLGNGMLYTGCDSCDGAAANCKSCEVGPDGNQLTPGDGRPYGASLLRYIAAVGYDGDRTNDLCDPVSDLSQNCGNYYFAPESNELARIFEDIASRIFTRLVK